VARARRARALTSVVLLALAVMTAAIGCGGGSKARPASGASGAEGSHVWSPGKPDTLGPLLAIVGGRRIRAHEVDSLIATAPPDAQQQLRERAGYKNLVERMVTEEAVLQAALRAGIQNDPGYKAVVAKAARDAAMRLYYQRRLQGFPAPSDSAIQAYYESHTEQFRIPARVKVRHIQVATKARAEALRKRLLAGALWDQVARQSSEDKTTRNNGGLIGYITTTSDYLPSIGKAPDVAKVAFELKEGTISKPVQSEKGWHLIKVESPEPSRTQPLADVRQGIVGYISNEEQAAFSETFLDSLRTSAGATIYEDSIAVAVQPRRSAQEFFKDAQSAATPEQRIDLYRGVAARFPDDPVSVQAEFMVGFTYAEDLGKYDEARAEFKQFIQRHPNHELANSAKWMLENMDKPAPDLKDAPEGADSTGADGTGAPPDSTR